MGCSEIDAKIRITILLEYCKRSYGQSDNPEMHFYVIPELRNVENEAIKANAVYLIDNNLVRGGLDDDGNQTFPWIRRITTAGMDLVETLMDKSATSIQELRDELDDHPDKQDRMTDFILYCLKPNKFPPKILNIAQDVVF